MLTRQCLPILSGYFGRAGDVAHGHRIIIYLGLNVNARRPIDMMRDKSSYPRMGNDVNCVSYCINRPSICSFWLYFSNPRRQHVFPRSVQISGKSQELKHDDFSTNDQIQELQPSGACENAPGESRRQADFAAGLGSRCETKNPRHCVLLQLIPFSSSAGLPSCAQNR